MAAPFQRGMDEWGDSTKYEEVEHGVRWRKGKRQGME